MSELHVILGTGAVGRAVANELVQQGASVRVLNRSGAMPEPPTGIELQGVDLYDPAAVREATQGAGVVYQCAGPPYSRRQQEFPPLQASIIEGLAGTSAKLVIVENLFMFGDTAGKPLSEDMPYAAQTRKGRTRATMSESAIAAHREGKVRVAIGRFGLFRTLGDNSPWAGASFPLFRGDLPSHRPSTCAHPHLSQGLQRGTGLLGERDEADGQAWHGPNDMPEISQGELVRLFCEEAGLEPKISPMGRPMLRLGGLFVPEARESLEMLYEFEKPFIVDSTKFERAFGMRPTPMREAIRETAAWYRERAISEGHRGDCVGSPRRRRHYAGQCRR
jgi:nucleoside-diphosphate-sugar epimerase